MGSNRERLQGFYLGLRLSIPHLVKSFLLIPAGIICIIAILYGFNVLLDDKLNLKLPSSVMLMLVNLIFLVILNAISTFRQNNRYPVLSTIGTMATSLLQHYLRTIQPPMNFCLKWINVFFIPSFVILPLSDPLSFVECMKIAGVFVIGGLTLMVLDVCMILSLKRLFLLVKSSSGVNHVKEDLKESKGNESLASDVDFISVTDVARRSTYISDLTTIELQAVRDTITRPEPVRARSGMPIPISSSSIDAFENPDQRRASILTAGGSGNFEFLLASNGSTFTSEAIDSPLQVTSELTQSWAANTVAYIDWLVYLLVFVISIPFYYILSIHEMLPFHLAVTVLAYYNALFAIERFPRIKRIAHPIIVLTFQILLVLFVSSMIYHKGSPKGFLDDLKFYKTGKNYQNLFSGESLFNSGETVTEADLKSDFVLHPSWPGCGDVLSSLMDVSIVSLSLPMFTHRKDFLKNFWLLVPPLVASMCMTFFCYPIICYKLGISSTRSIGFIGRLVTLALGTPLMEAMGGSQSLMAVCTILSGICGVLIGDIFFQMMRVPSNDFVTRGVTLGVNCGAIATAHLLNYDPRAASMSSLSFSVFGTMMIILASVGAIRDLIHSWVGL